MEHTSHTEGFSLYIPNHPTIAYTDPIRIYSINGNGVYPAFMENLGNVIAQTSIATHSDFDIDLQITRAVIVCPVLDEHYDRLLTDIKATYTNTPWSRTPVMHKVMSVSKPVMIPILYPLRVASMTIDSIIHAVEDLKISTQYSVVGLVFTDVSSDDFLESETLAQLDGYVKSKGMFCYLGTQERLIKNNVYLTPTEIYRVSAIQAKNQKRLAVSVSAKVWLDGHKSRVVYDRYFFNGTEQFKIDQSEKIIPALK